MLNIECLSKEFLSIFNTYFIMAISCLLYIFSDKNKQYKEMICLMFLTMLYNSILKELFKLPLPETCKANCYSFPSGHMNFQSIFYIWMIIKNRNNLFRMILLIFWIITGAAMVFAGYHFARDVIITPIFSLMFILLFKCITERLNNENALNSIFLIAAIIFSIINYMISKKFQYHVSLSLQSIYGLVLFSVLLSKRKMDRILKSLLIVTGIFYSYITWNKHFDIYLVILESKFFLIYTVVALLSKFSHSYLSTRKNL